MMTGPMLLVNSVSKDFLSTGANAIATDTAGDAHAIGEPVNQWDCGMRRGRAARRNAVCDRRPHRRLLGRGERPDLHRGCAGRGHSAHDESRDATRRRPSELQLRRVLPSRADLDLHVAKTPRNRFRRTVAADAGAADDERDELRMQSSHSCLLLRGRAELPNPEGTGSVTAAVAE